MKPRRGSSGRGRTPMVPYCLGFMSGVLCLALMPSSALLPGSKRETARGPCAPCELGAALGDDAEQHIRSEGRLPAPILLNKRRTEAAPVLEQELQQVPAITGPRKKVLAVVGVQTGFTTDPHPRYSYEKRRAALRATWFPPNQAAMDRLEEDQGIVVRFVVGHSSDPEQETALNQEEAMYGGFWRLPLQEGYLKLTSKSLMFLQEAALRYDAEYIIKMDDDVYFRVDRLPHAIMQWREMRAGYVGCFHSGPVFTDPDGRWYEPQFTLFGGSQYFAYAFGTTYVVSGEAAAYLSAMQPGSLRFFNNEDVTVGAWMLAFNVTHYDDRRLCEKDCSATSVVVYDPLECPGLCDPVQQLPDLHNKSECHLPPTPLDGILPFIEPVFDFSRRRPPPKEEEGEGLLSRLKRWWGRLLL